MPGFWNAVKQKIQTAIETPFDNSLNGFASEEVQGAIEELQDAVAVSASPGFTWGDVGSATAGTYLSNDDVSSNNSGRLVPFDGFITDFFINNERTQGTKTMEIVRRRPAQTDPWVPIFETTLGVGVNVVRVPVNVAVLELDELAVRVKSGSDRFQNPVVGIIISNNSGSGQVGGQFLQTEDEGSLVEATTTKYNFTGAGVTATSDGLGNVTVDIPSGGGGSGEANTASNTGPVSDADVFKQKTGVDLEFRRLTAGTNISITQNADDIVIAASGSAGEANTGANVGGGSEVFRDKIGTTLNFRTLVGTGDITVNESGDTIEIGGVFPVVDANVNKYAEAGDAAGGQTVSTAGFANLTFDTFESSAVATAAAGGITINIDGEYEISYDYTASGGSGSRSESESRLAVNGTPVALTNRKNYHRTTAQGDNSASCTKKLSLVNGDVVSLQAQRSAGGAPITTYASGTVLSVKYLGSTN